MSRNLGGSYLRSPTAAVLTHDTQIESLDADTDEYVVIDRAALDLAWKERVASEGDSTETSPLDALLPPLHHLLFSPASDADGLVVTQADDTHQITIVAYLDRSNPLTEARWVKTGEVEAWITSLGIESKTDVISEWKGKISVSDPDPVSPVSLHLRLETVANRCCTL